MSSSLATAQRWVETWGQSPASTTQYTPTADQPPHVYAEPAGYASQSTMNVIPSVGPIIWETYHADINVFSDAAYVYQWQNGTSNSYPWGQPIWYCDVADDTSDASVPVTTVYWTASIDANQTSISTILHNDTGAISDANVSWGGPVYIRVENEVMRLTSYDANNHVLTVVRGQLGTTAVAHTNTDAWYGRFGYNCQHSYLGPGGTAVPKALNPPSNFVTGNWVLPARHPFASSAYDATHDVLWVGGGFDETKKQDDLWAYCHQTSTGFCAGRPTMAFYTSGGPRRQDSVYIWDPDEKVLADFGGSVGGADWQGINVFCVEPNASVGCVNAGRWNQITTGTTTTYVSNPAAGPLLTAMRGVYDTQHKAFILWGGTSCVTPTSSACQASTSNVVYIFKWQGIQPGKWAWLTPQQYAGGTGNTACIYGTNCPRPDWRPAIAWDNTRNRVWVVDPSPYNGAGGGNTYQGSWDGGNPGVFRWINQNIAPAANWEAFMSQTQCPGQGPGWGAYCLDYPYMVYWQAHDALIIAGIGNGPPKSMAAWELALGGTAPAAGFSAIYLDFGTQVVGTASSVQAVTLTNTGNATLNISSIVGSGDFSRTTTCGSSLAPGASCDVNATFTPTVLGARTGALTFTDNAANSPQIVSLNGTGITTGGGGGGGGGGVGGGGVTVGPDSALVDSSTQFSTQLDGISGVFACPDCYFRSPADIMPGQTVEVRLRAGATSPTADEIALKQGTIDGQITSVQNGGFVFVPFNPIFGGQTLTVLTGSSTVFTNPSSPSVGNKVAVRGLLLRSVPGGPTVVARQVALIQ